MIVPRTKTKDKRQKNKDLRKEDILNAKALGRKDRNILILGGTEEDIKE